MALELGTPAPAFTLPDHDGNEISLSDFAGKTVVLYFYPKADTPGCTTQACGVRDHRTDYSGLGAVVLGVSPDPPAKIKKFVDKYDLGFTLLGDESHEVAERYDVWVEKSMYGKSFWGMERTSYVISQKGVIMQVFRKVKPAEHDEMVLAALA